MIFGGLKLAGNRWRCPLPEWAATAAPCYGTPPI